MGRIIDRTYLQMRLLNTQKGPAVWALRAQADKQVYQHTMIEVLEAQPISKFCQAEILLSFLFEYGRNLTGKCSNWVNFSNTKAAILATGI